MKEIILLAYLLCIILDVSGLTIALLAKNKSGSGMSKELALFLIGILIICCYDMAIYYSDYELGTFTSLKVMRIGNGIIAGTLFLWINLQAKIIDRDALSVLDKIVKRYQLFYMALWIVLTFTLSIEQFYTFKWLLLVTDIILIISSITASVGHIIYSSTAEKRVAMYYMIVVTSMIIWNYIAYFWGETSVYWGNSEFIRDPLDLTVIFWLIISVVTLIYEYREDFVPAFGKEAEEESGKKNLKERIEEVCIQYKLTPREKEFIDLIYSGKSNKEIAEILFLSESTVKTHIYNIFRKMSVKSRVELIYIVNEEYNDELPQH